MLYYKEDKLLTRPFIQIWDAIETLLELARPETIAPEEVIVWDSRGGAPASERSARTDVDGAAAVASLYAEARLLSQHPACRAYIRWNPLFGAGELIDVGDHLSRQLAISEQPVYGNTWAFLYLLTAFHPDDAAFADFLTEAKRRLRFSFLPQHWRVVEFTRAGRPKLRKLVKRAAN